MLRILALTTFIFVILMSSLSAEAAGEIDPTFAGAVYGTNNGNISVVKRQADGKILVSGFFSAANSTAASGLIRLNPDGSVDASFTTQNLFAALGIGASISALAVQSDGKILVGGNFFTAVGTAQTGVKRLNADGSVDATFTAFTFNQFSAIDDIEIQSDNKVLVGGTFSGAGLPENMARLNSNGTVDFSFASQSGITIKDIEIQADGTIIVGGYGINSPSFGVIRKLTETGAADPSFTVPSVNGSIEAVKAKLNGQILIGGTFTSIDGFTLNRIALMNANGSLDLTFNQNNAGAGGIPTIMVNDIELGPNGTIVIGGRFQTFNNVSRRSVARLNANGTLDLTFADNSLLLNPSTVSDLEVLPSGKVVVGVNFGALGVTIVMFNVDGSVDAVFTALLTLTGRVREVVSQADGKIMVGGLFPYVNGRRRNGIARLNADGSLDASFVPYLNADVLPRSITAMAVQADGKVLIGIESVDQTFRLNADGSRDLGFNSPFFGETQDIVVLPNGQILIGGIYGIRRLNSDGIVDAGFSAAVGGVRKILLQPDGKILIGGTFTQVGTAIRGRIARLNANGSLDDTFNPPGGANAAVEDFDLQSDGKVVLGGDFNSLNGSERLRIGRLNADGTLDNSFIQTVDGTVRAVKIQPDGKVLIAGSMGFVQSQSKVGLARLNPDGSLDSSFVGRPNTAVFDVTLQSDNKVLIGGEFILVNGASALRVARLLNSAAPIRSLFDYDGDGKSDVSVFRPSENRWYVFRSSDSGITQTEFAIPGDVPVPADYDGDGKTDIAIYRPSSGAWWYLSSFNGAQITAQWGGEAGDVPRPSDFDGDGKADFVFFRPTTNFWHRISSVTGTTSNIQFGLAGDKPVIGDFNGDGKSDVAIYRPSTGDWWYQSSINNAQLAVRWGISTDIPAPADFDGDGRTDFAVYRPSTGVWYVINSSNGSFLIGPFGIPEDKPVPADYDGDGKADLAVFRPSTGVWYQHRTNGGFFAMQFGVSTDTPTPNAFVP